MARKTEKVMQGVCFVIIGCNDALLYEYPNETALKITTDNDYIMGQFIILSALDFIAEKRKTSDKMFIKSIDVYGSSHLSALVTAGSPPRPPDAQT